MQIRQIRRRRTRAEAEQLAAAYPASGLSRADYCRQHQMSLATLARYQKRQAQGESKTTSRWLAVEVGGSAGPGNGSHSGLSLRLSGGRHIEIARAFDAGTLVQLLGVLERG